MAKCLLLVRRQYPTTRNRLKNWLEKRGYQVVVGESLQEIDHSTFQEVPIFVNYVHDGVETMAEMLTLAQLRRGAVIPLLGEPTIKCYFLLGEEAWKCCERCQVIHWGMHLLGVTFFVEAKNIRALDRVMPRP